MAPTLDNFFVKVLLPLLLTGCTQINRSVTQELTSTLPENGVQTCAYCWCGGDEEGRMIACDNPGCKVEWFHFGLTRKPRGKW